MPVRINDDPGAKELQLSLFSGGASGPQKTHEEGMKRVFRQEATAEMVNDG